MNFENTKPGQDLEGSGRDSADLQIAERMPQPRRLEMPVMSDQELYLRLNVPDGLQSNGSWPLKWQPEDPNSAGGIRHDRE
jgi:hypothetical protein